MKDRNLKGVGGWLAWVIFCFLFLSPLAGAGSVYKDLHEAEQQYPALLNLHTWTMYKTDTWIVWGACAAMSIYAGFLLLKRHNPHSVRFAIWSMWIVGPLSAIFNAFVIGPQVMKIDIDASYAATTLGSVTSTTVVCAIWTLYFLRSIRVGNTYGFVTRLSPLSKSQTATSDRKSWIRSTWDVGTLRNEGVRRLCIAVNVVGIIACALLIIGAVQTNEAGMSWFFAGAGLVAFIFARGVTWILSGFAR
ncbi:DUF2569 family protein [Burkholderia gladioli]|uniref:DUF2569 family protein n=1 Tax=Burkholderia gladioli TaxID=28095 RepID=UPI00163F921A|nr:DUF2569 family protein [Burkholderia gladioli]